MKAIFCRNITRQILVNSCIHMCKYLQNMYFLFYNTIRYTNIVSMYLPQQFFIEHLFFLVDQLCCYYCSYA